MRATHTKSHEAASSELDKEWSRVSRAGAGSVASPSNFLAACGATRAAASSSSSSFTFRAATPRTLSVSDDSHVDDARGGRRLWDLRHSLWFCDLGVARAAAAVGRRMMKELEPLRHVDANSTHHPAAAVRHHHPAAAARRHHRLLRVVVWVQLLRP